MSRLDGRALDELRPVRITPSYLSFAEGSALVQAGNTWVLCAVTVEEGVPQFRQGEGGWITAEYSMLPRSTLTRTPREATQGRVSGRTQEIQRLIGRSLRGVVDLHRLGERSLRVDCDVLQADGGTRTAAITGSYVALYEALQRLVEHRVIPTMPLRTAVAAVSVGIVGGEMLLDLCYEEDSQAAVDFNVVMTGTGEFVEVQGTAEGKPFSGEAMGQLIALASQGIRQLFRHQEQAIQALAR